MDLVLAFRSDDEDYVLHERDVAITGLLRCLLLARRTWMSNTIAEELQRLSVGLVDLSAAFVAQASPSASGATRLVVDEMIRILEGVRRTDHAQNDGLIIKEMGRRLVADIFEQQPKEEEADGGR